jgi:drug/metabolite transporter (DMT)-like permease
MEPGEALSAAAQIAVALAGFAGVVVAFRSKALHDWSPVDKLRLSNLLGNSLILFSVVYSGCFW